jgi:hypothetical protein
MSASNDPSIIPADVRGPGDPDAVETPPTHPEAGRARNIREEQLTQAAGTVPAAYVGSGDAAAGDKPEDADAALWDDET